MNVNENSPDAPAKKPSRELMGYVRAGLAYLDRYGGPRARVLRTLQRRARRKGLEAEAAEEIIAAAMAKLDEMDVIDDRAFAAGKAAALRRRGTSRRGALAKLGQAGVSSEIATEALGAVDAYGLSDDEDAADAERAAAQRYAERRRLGPWRFDQEERAARRDRDVAAMARAGFPVGLAIEVIDGNEV